MIVGLSAGLVFGLGDIVAKGMLKGGHFAVILAVSFVGSALAWVVIAPYQLATETRSLSGFAAVLPWSLFKGGVVVASSALCFVAIKALPMSVSAVLRASGIVWPIVGAFVVFGEILTARQSIAVLSVLIGGVWLAWSSRATASDKGSLLWVAVMLVGVVLSGSLSVYDRAVLHRGFDPAL